MHRLKQLAPVLLGAALVFATAPLTHAASYYPNAYPSQWYLLPGQQLSFNGSGFAPNESVQITDSGGTVATVTANGSGSFSANNVMTVPFSWQNSTQSFEVKGSVSSQFSTPHPITITIGTFYPQITPSSWWIGYNQGLDVSGSGFAPSEQVKLLVNGSTVTQTAADGSGNVHFHIQTPSSGGSATLTAQGLSSNVSSSRTIYLHS